MKKKGNNPLFSQPRSTRQPMAAQPDPKARRESADDSLENASPSDTRADEKVIVNEQVSNKTVNAPSQTAPNTSEGSGNDEEIVNRAG